MGANTLRLTRQAKGLTQAQLSRMSGTARPVISQIETGARQPWAEVERRLALALETPVDQLFPSLRSEPEKSDLLAAIGSLVAYAELDEVSGS